MVRDLAENMYHELNANSSLKHLNVYIYAKVVVELMHPILKHRKERTGR